MKKILFFLLLSVITLGVHAQAPSKKCPTCGLSMAKCKYKGKHSKTVAQNVSKARTGTENGHEWVDLGLSVKWAKCNVGASSPSDFGDYFAWGETRTKEKYNWENCFDCIFSDKSFGEKNVFKQYKNGSKTQISSTSGHDAAHENWGGTWRIPTLSEAEELCKKCKWKWTSINEHQGYIVTGPNGNTIFLPVAGWYDENGIREVNMYGMYWTSSLYTLDYMASNLYISNSGWHITEYRHRYCGLSIRPVK